MIAAWGRVKKEKTDVPVRRRLRARFREVVFSLSGKQIPIHEKNAQRKSRGRNMLKNFDKKTGFH